MGPAIITCWIPDCCWERMSRTVPLPGCGGHFRDVNPGFRVVACVRVLVNGGFTSVGSGFREVNPGCGNVGDASQVGRVCPQRAGWTFGGLGTVAPHLDLDTLFSIALLRGDVQEIPAAPADTTWTPGQRRLSTTAMPRDATRLEAWREGAGGMPEQLAIGAVGAAGGGDPGNHHVQSG